MCLRLDFFISGSCCEGREEVVARTSAGARPRKSPSAANRAGAIAGDSPPLRLKALLWQDIGWTALNTAPGLRESRLVARNLRFPPHPPNTNAAFAVHESSRKRHSGRTCYNLAKNAADKMAAFQVRECPNTWIFRASSCAAKAAFRVRRHGKPEGL